MPLMLQLMSCTRAYGLWSSRYGLSPKEAWSPKNSTEYNKTFGVEPCEVDGRGLDHVAYTLRKIPWVRCPGAGLVAERAGWYKACYLLLISPICRVTCPCCLLPWMSCLPCQAAASRPSPEAEKMDLRNLHLSASKARN